MITSEELYIKLAEAGMTAIVPDGSRCMRLIYTVTATVTSVRATYMVTDGTRSEKIVEDNRRMETTKDMQDAVSALFPAGSVTLHPELLEIVMEPGAEIIVRSHFVAGRGIEDLVINNWKGL